MVENYLHIVPKSILFFDPWCATQTLPRSYPYLIPARNEILEHEYVVPTHAVEPPPTASYHVIFRDIPLYSCVLGANLVSPRCYCFDRQIGCCTLTHPLRIQPWSLDRLVRCAPTSVRLDRSFQDDEEQWPRQADVVAGVRSRLDLPFHGGGLDPSGRPRGFLSCESTANTFR